MRFSTCYVSTASPELNQSEIENILDITVKTNNEEELSGILLFPNGNFLQVLEGEKTAKDKLYEKI